MKSYVVLKELKSLQYNSLPHTSIYGTNKAIIAIMTQINRCQHDISYIMQALPQGRQQRVKKKKSFI